MRTQYDVLSDSFSLLDLELFVRTAQTGNLSQAAREMSLQPATASASLKRLEQKLEARLIVRSTRSLRLTPTGEIFLAHARQALHTLLEARNSLHDDQTILRGQLRIAAPSDFGRTILRGWLDEFQDLHPQLSLMLLLSDRLTGRSCCGTACAFITGMGGRKFAVEFDDGVSRTSTARRASGVAISCRKSGVIKSRVMSEFIARNKKIISARFDSVQK